MALDYGSEVGYSDYITSASQAISQLKLDDQQKLKLEMIVGNKSQS